jgi:hypothetical protein
MGAVLKHIAFQPRRAIHDGGSIKDDFGQERSCSVVTVRGACGARVLARHERHVPERAPPGLDVAWFMLSTGENL